uniref:Vitellogenin-A2-like n=1 Tax=Geotrypetes seraphini TaxID=260995 RepID=A0A6P8NAK3_GEOSA|nr:vitellogenin-A2-like [Geotrypetes seraphini]
MDRNGFEKSEAKIKGGVFVEPEIHELIFDDAFKQKLNPAESAAREALVINPEVQVCPDSDSSSPCKALPKVSQALQENLAKPSTYECRKGIVSNIRTQSDEDESSTNLKRGILNALSCNTKPGTHSLQEHSIYGVCQTRYSNSGDTKANPPIVWKAIDFSKCDEKVEKASGIIAAFADSCKTCQETGRNLRGGYIARYSLKMGEKSPVIESVITNEVRQIYLAKDVTIVVNASQNLKLVGIRKNQPTLPDQELKSRGGLQYHFDKETRQKPGVLSKSQIEEKLQDLVNDQQKKNTGRIVAQLIESMSSCTSETILEVWKDYCAKSAPRREWCLTVIVWTGTTSSMQALMKMSKDLSDNEIKWAFFIAMMVTEANPKTMEITLESVKKFEKSPDLSIAFSTMVNKYCKGLPRCPEIYLEILHDSAVQAAKEGNVKDTILALKAIGNAGQPESCKILQKFETSNSTKIRTAAVMAFSNIAKKDPKKVQGILLPYILNDKVPSEVRMESVKVVLESNPDPSVVTIIANVARKGKGTERSDQVASYIVSSFKALSKSQNPRLGNVADACRVALRLLDQDLENTSYRFSKNLHFNVINSQIGSISADISIMNNPKSRLPVQMLLSIKGYGSCGTLDLLEVIVQGEGLEEYIRKQDARFSEYPMRKKIAQIVQAVRFAAFVFI